MNQEQQIVKILSELTKIQTKFSDERNCEDFRKYKKKN